MTVLERQTARFDETGEIHYPESDGNPIADNTLQYRYITMLQGGIDAIFADRPDVFVAGDLLWYPVQGQPTIRLAPDVLVAFGRPKGDRGSYQQWREGNIAPQVVVEILSPSNDQPEMARKLAFYDRYGVEEYYYYDPDRGHFRVWMRQNGLLERMTVINDWTSRLLGVRFRLENDRSLSAFRPDGEPFKTFVELMAERDILAGERDVAIAERDLLVSELDTVTAERNMLATERDTVTAERDAERLRAERLAELLRSLGGNPDAL